MKNVLLLLHDDEGQEGRLQVALDVTRALRGHLACLDVVFPPPVISEYSGIADNAVIADATARENRNLDAIEARLAKEDVSWDVRQQIGDYSDCLREAADLADLIVVSSSSGEFDMVDPRKVVGELAGRSRRPVLAVPRDARGIRLAGTALVAWDGTDQASEALRMATPLLALADKVVLLGIGLRDGDLAVEDAAEYLSRHSIHPGIMSVAKEGSVADTILLRATELQASYIVMGAFGHGRVLDALIGGVTGTVLEKSERPLLLAH